MTAEYGAGHVPMTILNVDHDWAALFPIHDKYLLREDEDGEDEDEDGEWCYEDKPWLTPRIAFKLYSQVGGGRVGRVHRRVHRRVHSGKSHTAAAKQLPHHIEEWLLACTHMHVQSRACMKNTHRHTLSTNILLVPFCAYTSHLHTGNQNFAFMHTRAITHTTAHTRTCAYCTHAHAGTCNAPTDPNAYQPCTPPSTPTASASSASSSSLCHSITATHGHPPCALRPVDELQACVYGDHIAEDWEFFQEDLPPIARPYLAQPEWRAKFVDAFYRIAARLAKVCD